MATNKNKILTLAANSLEEAVSILSLTCILKNFSDYLRLFLASLSSQFLQIGHYLLRLERANLSKKFLSAKLEIKSKQLLIKK